MITYELIVVNVVTSRPGIDRGAVILWFGRINFNGNRCLLFNNTHLA